MVRSMVLALLLAGFLGSFAAGQDPAGVEKPKVDDKKAAGPEFPEVDVHFLNGSLLRLTVKSEKLDITTEYGKLAVPIKDVRSIEFGIHYPDGVEAKIRGAINDLGAAEFRAREKASEALINLGPYSYPLALEASRANKETEFSRRVKEVLTKLEAKHPKKSLKTAGEDKLVTQKFTIVGRIDTPSIRAATELFGEVNFSLSKMATLRDVGGGLTNELTLSVDAAKYANQGSWMETSLELDGRTAVVITASGAIDTWPQQPGQYMVGPSGAGGGGGRIMINGQIVMNANAQGMVMSNSALYGKIGENGRPFTIGDRYSGTPTGEGKLFLTIGPSPWGCPSAGAYDVKITRQP